MKSMATLPAFLRRIESAQETAAARKPAAVRPGRDPFQLRALPHESVFFYCKKIDNSRLVREADPRARGACWSAIGAAGLMVALFTLALAPNVGNRVAGYTIEQLRAEEQRLLDDRRSLELQEAQLLSPQQLERLAAERNLVVPGPHQVVHLNGGNDGAVAMVKR
jgi:hypothetical protein